MGSNEEFFEALAEAPDAARALETLATSLREEGRWHELLEARLSQARLKHGLPVDGAATDAMPAEARLALEADYTAACEEVGLGLLAAGEFRDAWFYLKTAGKPEPIRQALSEVEPDEGSADALIELALHEGAAPATGYRWLINHYGTCNAVTSLEGIGPHLPVADLAGCALVLVDHLHAELLASVRAHIEREEGSPPAEKPLPELLAERDYLFAHEAAHVDASHLASAVRMGRALESPDALRTAWELADYGARLHPSLRYPDAAPFEDAYPAHRLFFAAQLDGASEATIDEAVNRFRACAEAATPETDGLAPVETLLVLLHRVGRGGEALAEFARLVPADAQLSPYAPTPLEIARASGDWAAYDGAMRARGDLVGFAQGRIARSD